MAIISVETNYLEIKTASFSSRFPRGSIGIRVRENTVADTFSKNNFIDFYFGDHLIVSLRPEDISEPASNGTVEDVFDRLNAMNFFTTPVGSGGGGGGGTGDASAANQSTQIALETQIRNRLNNPTSISAVTTTFPISASTPLNTTITNQIRISGFTLTEPLAVSANTLPLPSNAATETSLNSLLNRVPSSLTNDSIKVYNPSYDPIGGKDIIGTAQERFYSQFFDFDTDNDWEIIGANTLTGTGTFFTGSSVGMVVQAPVGGNAAGTSPWLRISAGTIADSATLILSRKITKPPLDLRFALTMSQRIAGNRVIVGLFECDPVTGELLRGERFRNEPTVLNIRNMVGFLLEGTTATVANGVYRTSESGIFTIGAVSFPGFTTVATGTTPNFGPSDEMMLSFERDRINFTTRDNNTTVLPAINISRNDAVPNPTRAYRMGIMVMNITAPATNTEVRIHSVNLMDSTKLSVSPRNIFNDANKAFPIIPVGTTPVSGSVTVAGTVTTIIGGAGAHAIGDVGIQYRTNPTGSAVPVSIISPATPAGQSVKAGSGRIVGYDLHNNATSTRYVKFYNATSVTMGVTNAIFEVALSSGNTKTISIPGGVGFSTGLQIAITAGRGATDNTSVGLAAGDITGAIFFA